MRIAWAVPCRYAEVHENVGHILGAGISAFEIPAAALPEEVSLFIVVCVAGSEHELGPGQEHILRARVLDPSMTEIMGLEERFEAGHFGPPGGESTYVRVYQPIIPIAAQGQFLVEFTVDGRNATTVPLNIFEPGPPTPGSPLPATED